MEKLTALFTIVRRFTPPAAPFFRALVVLTLPLWTHSVHAQVPDIDVSPTSLDFGVVNVGATTTLATTISNVGSGELTITELFFTGRPDFSLNPSEPGSSFTVAAGGSVSVSVDYTPSMARTAIAVLWIVSDDSDEGVVYVSLSGAAVACDINVFPTNMDFGVVALGATGTLSTTISNTGSVTCTVEALTLTGSSDFTLDPTAPVPPFSVAPGGSEVVSMDYAPSDFVDDGGILEIASDDPDEGMVPVALSGTTPTAACDIDVSPLALDFGSVSSGTTSTLATTLRNLGNADCTIDLSLAGSADFALNPAAPALPIILPFGESVDVGVDFVPADVGADAGTLDIYSNDPDEGVVPVALSGTGLGVPDIDLSPPSLDFGVVNVGATRTHTTTINNVGSGVLTVTELVFTGSSDFTLSATAPVSPFTVAAGGSVDVSVDYTPSMARAVNAVLWISSDDPNENFLSVSLSGSAVACDINIFPTSLDFGVVPLGTTGTLSITIGNNGSIVCTVEALSLAGSADFALNPAVPVLPFTVAAGGSVAVSVDYAPSDFVDDIGTFGIASDDPDEGVVSVALSGTAPAAECDIDVNPLALDFGSVSRGTSSTLATTIRNLGNADCTIDLSLAGVV